MHHVRLWVVGASLVLLTGCGTTVPIQSATGPGAVSDGITRSDSGLQAPGDTDTALGGNPAGGAAAGEVGGAAPDSLGSSGDASGSEGGPAASAGAPGTTIPGAGAGTGRGFTDTVIRLGVGTADDANAFAGGFGVEGLGYSGDPNSWLKALQDDLNKRGGLLGRKVELVKHDYNTAQLLNDPAAANQAACATWTQDAPVAAVLLAGLIVEDTLLSCLAKAGTPLIYPGASLDYPLHYQQTYKKFPLFFNLAQMDGDRYDRLAVQRLAARKFFSPWDTRTGRAGTTTNPVKVGLLGFDDNDGVIQETSRKRELARNGHAVAAESSIRCPRALTARIQCMQAAVLRLASNGVTHVWGADISFMNNARSQGYRPRYFIQTQTTVYAANFGPEQLNGAMGQGYVPLYDVEANEAPGDPTPATARCRNLYKAAGISTTDRATFALQAAACEEFFFLEAAVKKAGSLSPDALRAGFESLGSSQQSTLTWKSFLSPTQHTSAAVLRDLEYRTDIGRFAYASTTDYS